MSLNWTLIVVGAVLVLLEVLLGAFSGFDFLLIGSAMMLGGILGIVTHSGSLGVVTAGVLALVYVFVGRKRIRGRLQRPGITSNADALLGRTVQVSAPIAGDRAGRIRIEGDEWRAQMERPDGGVLELGRDVRIKRIDGVTVYVEPVERASGGAGA